MGFVHTAKSNEKRCPHDDEDTVSIALDAGWDQGRVMAFDVTEAECPRHDRHEHKEELQEVHEGHIEEGYNESPPIRAYVN